MEYQVPQFIEVENKLVGPLTLKQFIYIAGAIGLCAIFFVYLPIVLAFLLSALIVIFAAALSFYKINGKPFINVIEAGFNYYVKGKLFLWKHQSSIANEKDTEAAATAAVAEEAFRTARSASKLTRGKLSELALSLDTRMHEGEIISQK